MSKPLGIMASFSKVVFKKDGKEVFAAKVTSGGCFGPDRDVDVINRGYTELKKAIRDGALTKVANDFNTVSVGNKEFAVLKKGPSSIEANDLKQIRP